MRRGSVVLVAGVVAALAVAVPAGAEFGNASAQAQVDSLGVSQAFASSAYPGQSVLTADGSLSTVTDGRIGSKEIPEYPFIASSAYPSRPTDSVEAGTLTMRAESSSLSSAGLATDGLGARHQPCYYVLRGDGTGRGFVAPRGASAICS